MDIQNSRRRPEQHPQAIDGFFLRPSTARRPVPRPLGDRRRSPSPAIPPRRQIGGFNRVDGFHSAPRRAIEGGRPSISSGVPGSYAAAQFAHTQRRRQQPVAERPSRRARHHSPGKVRTLLRWSFRLTAACLILALVTGGLLFGKGYFKLKKVFNGSSSAAALQANVDPSLLKGEGDGRVNVLLLGVGGAGHDGSDLTDTMIVVSIDPVNNQAVLFSVPRDLWVKMPNNYIASYQKINAAYESGKYKYLGRQDASNANQKAIDAGFQAVDSTVENVLGVPIHYNALIDFQAFKQAIDTVGGVNVNVPEQLYDPTMAWENHWNPVLAKAGPQVMNGAQALLYVRSRETSSDFARSQRQRAVMLALKDKVAGLDTLTNPVKLSNLISAFGDNVKTDVSLADMTKMAAIMKKIPSNAVQSVGLADPPANFLTTGNINGLSVVEPRAGLEDYSAIQAYVRSKLKDGYIAEENANVTLLNGTVVPGLASEKADELKSYGYNVGVVANAPTSDYNVTQIVDLSHGSKKYTLNYLKNRYHVQTVGQTLPPGIVQGQADIVIILGTDASTLTSD